VAHGAGGCRLTPSAAGARPSAPAAFPAGGFDMNKTVSREQWLKARKALLLKEKALTRQRDELSAQRRELPWVKIDKTYVFDTPHGKRSLAELFEGRSQLIIKHFMLAPGQKDGCVGCSFETDHIEAALQHIEHHDVTVVVVARAPLAEIEACKQRMGWACKWVSSFGGDFNYDFDVSYTKEQLARGDASYNYKTGTFPLEDLSGFSVFLKNDKGEIFHTYSTFGRGAEEVIGTYMLLDLTPKGRNETGPNYNLTDWVRHHDRYDERGHVNEKGQWVAAPALATCCH
jgi:predicted dithiol-disulfide oxidoreductase (DUF899 family)